VDDVCAQLAPDAVDLEALVYPTWSSTLPTIALTQLPQEAWELSTQCFCEACAELFRAAGVDPKEARAVTARSARSFFGNGRPELAEPTIETALPQVRSRGVRELLDAVVPVAKATGSRVHELAFAFPAITRLDLQGLDTESLRSVDRVCVGFGPAEGQDLRAAFRRHSGRLPAVPLAAGLTLADGRSADALRRDVRDLAALGADGLSVYNLTLLSHDALALARAAAAAANGA
jgi:hypothetical protein